MMYRPTSRPAVVRLGEPTVASSFDKGSSLPIGLTGGKWSEGMQRPGGMAVASSTACVAASGCRDGLLLSGLAATWLRALSAESWCEAPPRLVAWGPAAARSGDVHRPRPTGVRTSP